MEYDSDVSGYEHNDLDSVCVEYASSGRASCRVCQKKIDLRDLRFGLSISYYDYDNHGGYKYAHFDCSNKWVDFQWGFTKYKERFTVGNLVGLNNLINHDKKKVYKHLADMTKMVEKARINKEKQKKKKKPVKDTSSDEDEDEEEKEISYQESDEDIDGGRQFQGLSVEYAKSGRASCRGCLKKIDLRELRYGLAIYYEDFGHDASYQYVHKDCVEKWDNFVWALKAQKIKIQQVSGMNTIINHDKKEITNQLNGLLDKYKKKQQKAKPKRAATQKLPEPVGNKKKQKKDHPLTDPFLEIFKEELKVKKYKDNYDDLFNNYVLIQGKTVKKLNEILEKNNLQVKGGKQSLVKEVSIIATFGVPPVCTQCGNGTLKFDSNSSEYICQGFEDEGEQFDCGFKFQEDEIQLQEYKE